MIQFSDSADYVTHGSGATIDDLSPFTMVMWVRPATSSAFGQLWIKQSGTTGRSGYRAGTNFLGLGGYISRASAYDERITTEFMTAGVAYFVAWTWDPTNKWRMYYGTESSAVVECSYDVTDQPGTGAASSDAAQSLLIGGTTGGGEQALADIGRVGYFSAELSLSNIESLRTSPPSTWEGLFASCELASDYTDTSTLTDVTSNSNDGTNTGGATASDPNYPNMIGVLMASYRRRR